MKDSNPKVGSFDKFCVRRPLKTEKSKGYVRHRTWFFFPGREAGRILARACKQLGTSYEAGASLIALLLIERDLLKSHLERSAGK